MNQKTKSLIEIHIAVVFFGIAGLFGKFLTIPSGVIVLGRVFFATLALIILLLYKHEKITLPHKKDYVFLSLIGIVLAIHWTTFFQSVQVSTVAIGLLSYSTFPVFVVFLQPFFLKERIHLYDVILAVITFFGVMIIIPSFQLGNNLTQGMLWGIASAVAFALLSIFNRKYVAKYSSLVVAFYQDAIASIALLPFLFLTKYTLNGKNIVLLLILGVLLTAVSHTLFIKGMKHIKVQTASIIASLEPVYGIIFAYFLLSEVPSLRTILGGLIILGTSIYASIGSRKNQQLIVPE